MKATYIFCEPHELKPGQWTVWPLEGDCYARCPNGLLANLSNHRRTVNQGDGSGVVLTVSPSIDCDDGEGGHRFHGFIENGVWLGEDRQPVSESEK